MKRWNRIEIYLLVNKVILIANFFSFANLGYSRLLAKLPTSIIRGALRFGVQICTNVTFYKNKLMCTRAMMALNVVVWPSMMIIAASGDNPALHYSDF